MFKGFLNFLDLIPDNPLFKSKIESMVEESDCTLEKLLNEPEFV